MAKARTETTRDLYTEVTDAIVSMLETDPGRWLKPWAGAGGAGGLPINGTTGRAYRGVNIPMLWAAQRAKGYTSNRWASFQQWKAKGGSVRKGEKASTIVFYKSLTVQDRSRPETPDATKNIPLLRCWSVFNADQVDGLKAEPQAEPKPLPDRLLDVEAFIVATKATISHGGDKAYYMPAIDAIRVPDLAAFVATPTSTAIEGYYSTLLHELTHWTGAKARCNRSLRGRFGDEEYAAEELIAELGAAFMCAQLGITADPRPDHAKYIANWIKVLKNDKRAIFTAASAASKAADYLIGLQGDSIPAEPDQDEASDSMHPEAPQPLAIAA